LTELEGIAQAPTACNQLLKCPSPSDFNKRFILEFPAGRSDLLGYTATKGAVISFTRGLSNQYINKGIRVNTVATDPVWTPLIPSTMDDKA
jgi:NAD(P)-dependent dehydrogenase (short-subunit alcohol dehydrogenase family)